MKDVYLVYNEYTKTYHYYEGRNRHNHEYINNIEEVFPLLKKRINNKSNVILTLENLEKKVLKESVSKIHNLLPKIKIDY